MNGGDSSAGEVNVLLLAGCNFLGDYNMKMKVIPVFGYYVLCSILV